MHLREHVSLAPYTTFAIGGPARWFADIGSESDLLAAVSFARERQLPIFVMGGGSNLLVADEGFPGVVLHMAMGGVEEVPASGPGSRTFAVAAGENWDAFVSFTVSQNLGGMECLAGIPGTVGGTPIQNVGAYGQEVATTIRRVRALDLHSLSWVELTADQCSFSYRQSLFNTTERNRYIVTRVWFDLETEAKPVLSYPDLKRYFQDRPSPNLAQTAAAVREIRRGKGMLLVSGDPDCQSAGSFFKNPIVPAEKFNDIAAALKVDAATVPHYPAGAGTVKLPAAWLLEQAGFHKGYALGPAAISSRHTLALTNRGHAHAADVLALSDQITRGVKKRFGIELEREPILVGSRER
jgi:UDP-N-acetylmuramate dehydrogenase